MSATAIPRSSALPFRRDRVREDPVWVRPALAAVLALSAVLVLWGLTASGYSNTYYAAAAKAGSVSWKAWFFGSLDPGSFITVDKPPLSLWLMGLSARVFGFSSFSILLPQALCTIASVGLLFATVKRVFGPSAGLIAAAALAITPVTVAIGRVNNPDALLVLLLIGSAYLTVRAIESGRTRTLAWAGVLVGLAFMTKMLQGWMIAPALAGAYLLAGRPALGRRVGQLLVAGAAMVAASAAWPLAVTLWPGDRPFIGGSTDGGVWDLILGYNGFGRLFGEGGGGGMGAGFGGVAGLLRLFNAQVGGQVAWLLPLAGAGLAVGLYRERTRMARAGYALFGIWAVTHVLVFSFQKGIFHPYYVSALAPAVAALCGGGLVAMVRWARESWTGVGVLAFVIAGSAELAVALLDRTPDFAPWLRIAIPVAALAAAGGAAALKLGMRRLVAVGAVAMAFALAAGPGAYSVATAGRSLNGNNVTAGPASSSRGGAGGGGSGMGGVSDSTIAYLQKHQGSAKYLVAAMGSQTTASIIIATGEPVVTIGGFSGQDDAPTVSELAAMVKNGELRYVLLSGNGGGGPGGGGSSSISDWVQAHGTEVSDGLWKVSA